MFWSGERKTEGETGGGDYKTTEKVAAGEAAGDTEAGDLGVPEGTFDVSELTSSEIISPKTGEIHFVPETEEIQCVATRGRNIRCRNKVVGRRNELCVSYHKDRCAGFKGRISILEHNIQCLRYIAMDIPSLRKKLSDKELRLQLSEVKVAERVEEVREKADKSS